MKKGFTMIELMIVVVILGILAAIVVPRFIGREEEARVTAARVQISNFETALDMFRLDNGFYPSTEQGLSSLVEEPSSGREPRGWKQYLARIPTDPWGNEYVYISPGSEGRDYEIISPGPDGEPGTEDDIASWMLD
jgi:general secretion pathway protein G